MLPRPCPLTRSRGGVAVNPRVFRLMCYSGPFIEPLAAGNVPWVPPAVKGIRSEAPRRELPHAVGRKGEKHPMNGSLRTQIETYLSRLNDLIRRGCQVHDMLTADPSDISAVVATRAWQQDCGVTVNELSGGSKAHWLARSFSEAFLMRSSAGPVAEDVPQAEIVKRVLDVLEQAVGSLKRMDDETVISASSEAPPVRRFDFVYNPELRTVIEQAYIDSLLALEQKDYERALSTSCGILEAIVTDALEHRGLSALTASGAPQGKIAAWSFQTRLAVAEKAGLIRGGWARLPAAAWTYRDHPDTHGDSDPNEAITERAARLAGQVLHVVMRDLNPGR